MAGKSGWRGKIARNKKEYIQWECIEKVQQAKQTVER